MIESVCTLAYVLFSSPAVEFQVDPEGTKGTGHTVCGAHEIQASRITAEWCVIKGAQQRRIRRELTNYRQHIVAHSLGSALVAHILSNQPTVQVPLSQLSAEAKETKTQFIFDTRYANALAVMRLLVIQTWSGPAIFSS